MLDNPIWSALTTDQRDISRGDSLARRLPDDISPLSGIVSQHPEAYAALAKLAPPTGQRIVLFLDKPPDPPAGWQIGGGLGVQMILTREPLPDSDFHPTRLGEPDVPEMLALTQLTKPGPFLPKTHTLGDYWGIRENGRLIAMAGERLHWTGYREVSAVCTHPDFRGKGHAQRLMHHVARGIIARGETPILHAWADNEGAIRVYEKLGYVQRRRIHIAVLYAPEAMASAPAPAGRSQDGSNP